MGKHIGNPSLVTSHKHAAVPNAMTRGAADHAAQAATVYRTKPLPALGDIAEHQVREEFQRIERVLDYLTRRISDLEQPAQTP